MRVDPTLSFNVTVSITLRIGNLNVIKLTLASFEKPWEPAIL